MYTHLFLASLASCAGILQIATGDVDVHTLTNTTQVITLLRRIEVSQRLSRSCLVTQLRKLVYDGAFWDMILPDRSAIPKLGESAGIASVDVAALAKGNNNIFSPDAKTLDLNHVWITSMSLIGPCLLLLYLTATTGV